MSDDDSSNSSSRGLDSLTPDLSHDRPLDSLVPEMQKSGLDGEDPHADAPTRVGAIHPRALEVGLEEGNEWTLALWSDPGPGSIDNELMKLLRATILNHLTTPPQSSEDGARFVSARLFSFESLAEPTRQSLEDVGWSQTPYDPEEYTERMKAWQNEARAADRQVPARPISIWELTVEQFDPDYRSTLDAIEGEICDGLGDEVWGETPGGMSKLLGRALEERFDVEIGLDRESLETMADRTVPEVSRAIAGTRPVFFQALCDFCGVLLHGLHGVRVQWGLCEPDERGIVPPPTFREPATGETIPIGRALLDWRIAPGARPDGTNLSNHLETLVDRIDSNG